jgi:hypothetical protein
MEFVPEYKKPGDLIRSEEWNKILDELVNLKKYIENMSRTVTLTSLASPIGRQFELSAGVTEEFNYGINVMGLITRQYYLGGKETGDICKFGLNDQADIISYWSGAANGDKDALEIMIEYVDGSNFTSEKLFIHEWSNLRAKGNKNPYVEYLQSPNQRLWYRYLLVNPHPEISIRFITFRDINPECATRIANVIHYTTRVKQLQVPVEKK